MQCACVKGNIVMGQYQFLNSIQYQHFCRAMHFSAKRGIAIVYCLSVCLSVCPLRWGTV